MKRIVIVANLIKLRLSLAVTFSALTGYLISKTSLEADFAYLIIGIFLMASGSAALNQYTEREFDALMERTKGRPIPQERISNRAAIAISALLFSGGTLSLLLAGIVSALLGIFTVFLYNIIYTRLKRISPFAIIPGALVGAIPPIIGFTASGARELSSGIIFFSTFMFLWQLPHFALILMKYRSDYKAAGFRITSDRIDNSIIKKLVFSWVIISTMLLFIFSAVNLVFNRYLTVALIPVNIVFILTFHSLLFHSENREDTKGAFILINVFSLIVMLLFILNALIS